MGYKYQCDLNQQNCPTLYPEGLIVFYRFGRATLSFTNQSCVRDRRLEGNIGRCGFPGAPCTINETASNCASGVAETCIQGTCQGAPGFPCGSDDVCNWGVSCNDTTTGSGICGGNSAYVMNDEAADGLDFGRDYCASGAAIQDSTGDWICSSGPLVFVSNATYAPSAPTSTTSSSPFVRTATQHTAAIVGSIIGAITLFLLLLSMFLYMRERWSMTNRRLHTAGGEEISRGLSEKLAFLSQSTPSRVDNAIQRPPSSSLFSDSHIGEKNPRLSLSMQSKRGWISRILVFLALETAYLGLLAIAGFQPIVLPRLSLAHLTEAKGVTTIFAIAWQTLAILPITDILSTIFSSEWSHSFWRTGKLTPGKTDRVSMPTAGLLDRSKHFCASNASLAFRLAFPASILAQALVGIAPGALTVNTIFIPSAVRTQAGSIDLDTVDSYGTLATSRPSLLVRTEQVEHGQYGFRLAEPGVFVGWPQLSNYTATIGNLTYPSDIVRFDYGCRWTAPTLVDVNSNLTVAEGGIWAVDGKTNEEEQWETHGDIESLMHVSSKVGIFPLIQFNGDISAPRVSSRGISAWLFLGSNSSYPDSDVPYSLDLGNVSASYNETHYWSVTTPGADDSPEDIRDSGAPLASVLLCDPKMVLSTTYVTLQPESNMLSISNVTLPSRVGNISPAAAGLMLAQSLLGFTTLDCDSAFFTACNTSASIFLQGPIPEAGGDTVHVRSASDISSTIGSYVASASKAWSDGRYTSDKFSGISVDAIKEMPKLAFVASGPLTITVGVLAFIVLELVAAELWIPVGEPLGIASLTDALNSWGS